MAGRGQVPGRCNTTDVRRHDLGEGNARAMSAGWIYGGGMVKGKMMKKKLNIREIIKAQLKATGRTANWLAKQQTAVHENTCRTYLYGGRDTSGRVLGELLAILELEIVPKGKRENHE